ncbi:MAG: GNAT family N-acetyltransferase [Halanaerobiales bacterium]|nr:GNAT family N-acetyltransferase [Halanaerobiales bacterium]
MIELRELSINDGEEIYNMLQDIDKEENGFHNEAQGLTYKEFEVYLKTNKRMSEGKDLPKGYVPQTLYWLFVEGKPVGLAKLRHYLNESLREKGGHAAYAIRKSKRRQGYGKLILRELLKKAKEKKIDELLLTCDDDNLASRRVIEANGGELEKIKEGECYYWIRENN